MKLPKINLGVTTKRNFFDLKHDVSTTCDFGFVQPTIVQSLIPNSKIDVKSSSFLRLAPMPCPTFGRVKVQTDNVFVPTKDVQLNIDHMLAGTQYQTPLFHGTVTYSDSIPAFKMFWALIQHNEVNWSIDAESAKTVFGDGNRNLFNQIFRFSFSTNQDLKQGTPTNWHDLQSYFESFGLSNTARVNYVRLIESLTGANNNNSDFFDNYHVDGDDADLLYLQQVLSVIGRPGIGKFFSVSMYDYYLHSFLRPYEVISYASRADDSTFNWSDQSKNVALAYSGMSEPFRKYFDTVITSENADYSFQWCPVQIPTIDFETENADIDWIEQTVTHEDTAIYWRLNIQLTPFGRKLFKIFNACHMHFKHLGYEWELNKLYAYYKAWFDLYNPGRTLNWEDTNAYRLIHAFYDYPASVGSYLYNASAPEPGFDFSVYTVFQEFLTDLSLCNYYLDTDNITVATRLPQQFVNAGNYSTARSTIGSLAQISGVPGSLNNVTHADVGSGSATAVPVSINSGTGYLQSLSVKLLERLYNYVNRESVLASRIEDILKTKYGIDVHTSTFLGRDDFYCQISDIMGTVNNDETALGEYAGRGLGSGDSKVHYEASQFGYYIQLVTVVPLGGYVQASEKPLIYREDYYTPDFDSLGYEEFRESEVFGRESIINCFGEDKTFGFRPRFFNLKVKNNLNNGGFAFRSQRGSFLPYCLDRIFSEGSYNDYSNTRTSPVYGSITYGNYSINQPLSLKPVEELRSIGLYETYGNYDRMFYDTSGMSDNFILHQVHEFKYYAPMKPIADSFDTVNDEVNDDVTKVEHN